MVKKKNKKVKTPRLRQKSKHSLNDVNLILSIVLMLIQITMTLLGIR